MELGALVVAGAGGGDEGHQALELNMTQRARGLAKRGDGLGKTLEVVDVAQQLEREGEILVEQQLYLVQIRLGLVDHLEQLHHHQLGRRHGGLLHDLGMAEEEALEQLNPELLHPLELGLVLHLLGEIGEGQVAVTRHEAFDAGDGGAAQVELDDVDIGQKPLPGIDQGEVVQRQAIAQLVELDHLGQQGVIGVDVLQDLDDDLVPGQALGQTVQQQGVGEIDEAGVIPQQLIDVLLHELFGHQSGGGLLCGDGWKDVVQAVAKQQFIGLGFQVPIQNRLPGYIGIHASLHHEGRFDSMVKRITMPVSSGSRRSTTGRVPWRRALDQKR